MKRQRRWPLLVGPVVFGLALGAALEVFLTSLPRLLGSAVVVVIAVAAWWWAWRQYQWARKVRRELGDIQRELGDGDGPDS